METTLTKQSSPQKLARERFKHEFYVNGVQPVDGRQPIPDEIAVAMVQELDLPKDALIGVVDAFLILSTHLKEAGYTNLVLLESSHQNLTSLQEKYYNNVKTLCKKSGIEYCVNYEQSDMRFDVIIGNPPYSDRTSDSPNSKNLDNVFFEEAIGRCRFVSMVIRAKHFVDARSNFRRKLFTSGHLVSIERLDESVFPTIQNTETCVVTWDIDHKGPCKVTYKDGTVREVALDRDTVIKLDNPEFGKIIENNLADRWIRGKTKRREITEGNAPMVEIAGTGDTPVVVNIPEGQETTAANRYGVVMNVMGSYGSFGKIFVKPFEASISSSVVAILTDTQEEAIQLFDYLNSDEVSQIVAENKQKACNTKTLFSNIPSPF